MFPPKEKPEDIASRKLYVFLLSAISAPRQTPKRRNFSSAQGKALESS
jgi:hypothetical protein